MRPAYGLKTLSDNPKASSATKTNGISLELSFGKNFGFGKFRFPLSNDLQKDDLLNMVESQSLPYDPISMYEKQ